MNNEVMTLEQLQNALGTFVLKSNALADGIGVMQNTLKQHEKGIMQINEEIASIRDDFEAEKERTRNRERIEADEVNHITEAIKSRVTDLLSKLDRFDKFGALTAKCRCDAKRHSYYRGINAVDTKVMYYNDLLEYIGKWTPEGYGGVSGYINHLDAKEKKG